MRPIKLSKEERAVENALLAKRYQDVSKADFESFAQAVSLRRKDSVLNIRVNSQDLKNIKQKAKKLGVKYQTFISEILHRIAHN